MFFHEATCHHVGLQFHFLFGLRYPRAVTGPLHVVEPAVAQPGKGVEREPAGHDGNGPQGAFAQSRRARARGQTLPKDFFQIAVVVIAVTVETSTTSTPSDGVGSGGGGGGLRMVVMRTSNSMPEKDRLPPSCGRRGPRLLPRRRRAGTRRRKGATMGGCRGENQCRRDPLPPSATHLGSHCHPMAAILACLCRFLLEPVR